MEGGGAVREVQETSGTNGPAGQEESHLVAIGRHFESCISDVESLERQHAQLVQELLQLEQPMAQAVQTLREQQLEARRQLSHAQTDRLRLQEETQLLKRRLFVIIRECIQNQVVLAVLQHEAAQSAITQEELQAQIPQLTQEALQLREAQQARLSRMRAPPPASRPRAYSLEAGRQASLEMERYSRGEMSMLETRYEPLLLGLLRRRQAGEEALRRTREFCQDLRAQSGPLREQTLRLGLQRACLEDRIGLMEQERRENLAAYRETAETLEETARQLRTELQVLRRKTEELQGQRRKLQTEAEAHRLCIKALSHPGLPAEAGQDLG